MQGLESRERNTAVLFGKLAKLLIREKKEAQHRPRLPMGLRPCGIISSPPPKSFGLQVSSTSTKKCIHCLLLYSLRSENKRRRTALHRPQKESQRERIETRRHSRQLSSVTLFVSPTACHLQNAVQQRIKRKTKKKKVQHSSVKVRQFNFHSEK